MDKKDNENSSSNDEAELKKSPKSSDRRNVLKKSITIGGATIIASEWSRPIVETVILPAHAQTSPNSTIAIIVI